MGLFCVNFYCRAAIDQLARAKATIQSLRVKLPGFLEQASETKLPKEGWNACERLLKGHGAE